MKYLICYALFSLFSLPCFSQEQTEQKVCPTDAEIAVALCDIPFWDALFNSNHVGSVQLIHQLQFVVCSDYVICQECIEKNSWLKGPALFNPMIPIFVSVAPNCNADKLERNFFALEIYHNLKRSLEK